MRVKLISDIHHEFDRGNHQLFIDSLPNENVDVLVIAGDLATGDLISKCIRLYCNRFKNVIYVMGNHCVWKTSIENRIKEFTNLDDEIENFHFLENRRIEIDGQGFAGCTLWFGDSPMTHSQWVDFRFVEGGSHSIHKQNTISKEFLRREVQEGDIVITHHLPSKKSIHSRWEGDPDNCYFVCEVDDVIHNNKPAIWMAGHSHDACNMYLVDTWLLRNPRGYPYEGVNCDFDLIIDTEIEKLYTS